MDGTASNMLLAREMQPGTRQVSVFVVCGVFILIGFAVLALRLFVRIRIIKAVGMDDILMTIGMTISIALGISSMVAAYYGTGKHIGDIHDWDYIPWMKSTYTTRILYVIALLFIKMSILFFYLRLDHRQGNRWAVFFLMFVVMGLSLPSLGILAFSCFPPAMFWDQTVKGSCMDPMAQQHFYDANGALNIVTDLAIYCLPIPMVWNLHVSRRQKIALFGVFALGIVAIAAGCVRFGYVRLLSGTTDQSYYLADALNWCAIECFVGAICGSASVFKAFVKHFLPRFFGTSRNGAYGSEGQYPSGSNSQHPLHILSNQGKNYKQKTIISGRNDAHNESEEMIIPEGNIMTKTEVRMDVTTTQVSHGDSASEEFSPKSSPRVSDQQSRNKRIQ